MAEWLCLLKRWTRSSLYWWSKTRNERWLVPSFITNVNQIIKISINEYSTRENVILISDSTCYSNKSSISSNVKISYHIHPTKIGCPNSISVFVQLQNNPHYRFLKQHHMCVIIISICIFKLANPDRLLPKWVLYIYVIWDVINCNRIYIFLSICSTKMGYTIQFLLLYDQFYNKKHPDFPRKQSEKPLQWLVSRNWK